MVPSVTPQGRSFKGAAAYYLHDKRQAGEAERLTSDRVAWTHTLNLATDDPDRAWRIMADTAMRHNELKVAAGNKATKPLSKPVYAYSLSWHPDDPVTQEEQLAAALESLKVQGLEDYQALIVAHNDEPQRHVHVLLNRVHPETGLAVKQGNNFRQFSKWAEAYEKRRGKIYCQKRVENNQKREQGERVNEPRKSRTAFEFEKATGNDSLSADFIKSNEKQKDAQLYDIGRSIKESHARQWAELKRVYAVSRAKISDHGQTLKDNRAAEIKQDYKEKWRLLFRKQRIELEAHGSAQNSFLSRLFSGLSLLDEFKRHHDGDTLMILFALVSRKGHMDVIAARHERERRELATEIRDVTREAGKLIDKGVRQDLDRLRGQFLSQCADLRTVQDKQTAEQRERWKVRNAERKTALAPYRARPQRNTSRSRDVGRSRSVDPNTPRGGRRGPGMRPANKPKPD